MYLKIAGVVLAIGSERQLKNSHAGLRRFLTDGSQGADVQVKVSWDWDAAKRPKGKPSGRDLVQLYYDEGDDLYCELDGGARGALASVHYTPDLREMTCTVCEEACHASQTEISSVLRMLPMRQIMQKNGVIFFHAAQIAVPQGGILFTAPSGTGKTTQAGLWAAERKADIICNDRTLLRRTEQGWQTYGYPVDGSEPVCSTQVHPLRAIVLLEQAPVNRVQRMRAGAALPCLLPQLVIDGWSAAARTTAAEQLLQLLGEIPVYQLACTPDRRAVDCLERQLKEDGVISLG